MNWTRGNIIGRGQEPPPVSGRYAGRALAILATGRNFWDCFKWLPASTDTGDIMAINRAAMDMTCPWSQRRGVVRFQHFVTMHSDHVAPYMHLRGDRQFHAMTHSNSDGPGVDIVWKLRNLPTASGGFAACVALMLGYSRILLLAMPSRPEPHYWEPPEAKTPIGGHSHHDDWWRLLRENFGDRIRATCGLTAEIFGQPEEGWLRHGNGTP